MNSADVLQAFVEAIQQGLSTRLEAPAPLVMIAGPNGSGKSTLWHTVLAQYLGAEAGMWEFINADEIVQEHLGLGVRLDSLDEQVLKQRQQQAQELTTQIRSENIEAGQGFVFETVFSDEKGHKLSELRRAKEKGFLTVLVAVAVEDIEVLLARVSLRQKSGAHGVEEEKQRSRYPRVLSNFEKAIPIVNVAVLIDNSGQGAIGSGQYRFVACVKDGEVVACVDNMPRWAQGLISRPNSKTIH